MFARFLPVSTGSRQVWMGRPILGIARIEDLGPSLRDLRKSQDVTLLDACEAMGKNHITHLSAWERGATHPQAASLIELLDVYDYMQVFMHKDEFVALLKRRGLV